MVDSCAAATKERAHDGGKAVSIEAAHKAVGKKAAKPVVHKQKPGQSKAKRVSKPSTVKKASIMNILFKTSSKVVRQSILAAAVAIASHTTVSISLCP